jgi:guanylate kinase
MDSKGRLFIISGPSGVGKSNLINDALGGLNNFMKSVSVTTRPKRNNESRGKKYRYISKKHFGELVDKNLLLEWANYCDYLYGTPKDFVEKKLEKGKNIVLEIEVKGAMQVKEKIKDVYLIFINITSLKDLEDRLIKRGTDSLDEIKKRMKIAKEEIKFQKYYDCIIVNNNYNEALQNLKYVLNLQKGGV